MSNHRATLSWSRNADVPFTYDTYSRDHRLSMETGLVFPASAAPEYKGNPERTNPEELLVAAISSCHMLTFLAVAAKKGFVVESYDDDAVGVLERPEGAPMHITRCTLRPRITFSGNTPDPETITKLHEQAHRGCFIANSVKTVVTVEAPAS
ncbi:MAG: OsmC family protein [Sandaracinaceae bacterium]|jgi:organic hydroperoxide reductase OsmC/OhrA|nr:OsmC family protein [Sandaracinaceae bacterium]